MSKTDKKIIELLEKVPKSEKEKILILMKWEVVKKEAHKVS